MFDFDVLKKKMVKDLVQIARGGQKVVYSTVHPQYGDIVLKLYFYMDARALREIDIIKNCKFDCVPIIYETGNVIYENTETLYVIEQRIDGEMLRNRIVKGEKFTLKEAVDFLEQGLMFIMQLEEKNIVHRDIKPENIIISADSRVFFLDFGIARMLDMPSLTKTEAIAGPHTPGYAAPEQFNNFKKDIDSRSDLFSIGVVTYECLTGKNPFRDGASSHLDILQRTKTITPISFHIKGDTQYYFMGFLSSLIGKYPSRRPKNAKQALEWLNSIKCTLEYEE